MRIRDLSAQIDQPFGAQRLQGAFRQLKLADLMAIDRALQQRRERLLLFRRAFQAFGRGGASLFGGEPLPQRRGLGRAVCRSRIGSAWNSTSPMG